MLSKKYNFKESEQKWQNFWEENSIYKFDRDSEENVYSIDTPPPTVSGSLHIGHIFSYTQSEIIARYQRMQGKNVMYPFGFDDNGLPTERLVEREEGIQAKDLPRKDFSERCVKTTNKYIQQFKKIFMSMGFSTDWSLQYDTANPEVQKISQKSFIELVKKGKAYQKEMPVLWCTTCQTSIAQAELETIEKETTFNYIPFIIDGEELLVATTRPELLFGCVCLFINPEDLRYNKYIGKSAVVPLYEYSIPIMGDEKVAVNKGTGAVMCATFGDNTDLEWYETYNLPYRKIIGEGGFIEKSVPYIGGLKVLEARKKIIELLTEKDLLKKSEAIIHTVSVHERCSKEIEIIPSKQWYIDILNDKDKFLKAGDEINWYPKSMKARYDSWVSNLKWDWCISRQRYFGVSFPVWYCKNCGEIMLADEEQLPINPMEVNPHKKCSCGCSEFLPEKAVMDTWATSSLTPFINVKDEQIPMSLRTQAHEIIRTWSFYTIVRSLYNTGRIPWKNIMLSGFILAKKGEKISKSKNNGKFSPELLIENHSADVLRYWTASARLGTDTMFSEDELKTSNRFLTKLWNAAKFVFMHLNDYNPNEMGNTENLQPIDKWIIEKSKFVTSNAKKYLDEYEVGMARQEADKFFWSDFCDNYLEIVKDRLYKPEVYGKTARLSAQYALYKSFLNILKLYAIFVPHITEEIYQEYFKNFEDTISIHLSLWEEATEENEKLLNYGDEIKNILEEVRKYKSSNSMSLKERINVLEITSINENIKFLESTKLDLKACTSAEIVEISLGDALKINIM